MVRRIRTLVLPALALTLAAGCRLASLGPGFDLVPSRPVAPVTAGRSALYPLTVGNRWESTRNAEITLDGNPLFAYHASVTRELTCAYTYGGRDYVIERTHEVPVEGAEQTTFVHYRQDARGLYERDLADPSQLPAPCDVVGTVAAAALRARPDAGDPPATASARAREQMLRRAALVHAAIGWSSAIIAGARPAPTPAAGEIVRLAYPLAVGTTWVIRADPRFESRVERVEPLRLAFGTVQAYRIRITSDLFGSDTDVRFWYGRDGFLGLEFHDRLAITDDSGNVIGIGTYDERELLDAFEPAGAQ